MKALGIIFGLLFFFGAFVVFGNSQSAIHEGLAALFIVGGLLWFVLAMLADVVTELKKLRAAIPPPPEKDKTPEVLYMIQQAAKEIAADVQFIKKAKAAEILRRKQERQET